MNAQGGATTALTCVWTPRGPTCALARRTSSVRRKAMCTFVGQTEVSAAHAKLVGVRQLCTLVIPLRQVHEVLE